MCSFFPQTSVWTLASSLKQVVFCVAIKRNSCVALGQKWISTNWNLFVHVSDRKLYVFAAIGIQGSDSSVICRNLSLWTDVMGCELELQTDSLRGRELQTLHFSQLWWKLSLSLSSLSLSVIRHKIKFYQHTNIFNRLISHRNISLILHYYWVQPK